MSLLLLKALLLGQVSSLVFPPEDELLPVRVLLAHFFSPPM